MTLRRFLAIIAITVLAAACSADPDPAAEPSNQTDAPEATSLQRAAALIDTEEGSVLFEVEVARTEEEKQQGLMGRESMPDDRGMAFLFFEPTTGGFWMKDTLIPLSIAFIGSDERIQEIRDMDPCVEENCPIYAPTEPYTLALEVNQGAFEEAGVDVGDRVTISF